MKRKQNLGLPIRFTDLAGTAKRSSMRTNEFMLSSSQINNHFQAWTATVSGLRLKPLLHCHTTAEKYANVVTQSLCE